MPKLSTKSQNIENTVISMGILNLSKVRRLFNMVMNYAAPSQKHLRRPPISSATSFYRCALPTKNIIPKHHRRRQFRHSLG
jgi:hypothetical protein